jgi:hypothetical protein
MMGHQLPARAGSARWGGGSTGSARRGGGGQSPPVEVDWHRQAWAAALVLVILVLRLNVGARLLVRHRVRTR